MDIEIPHQFKLREYQIPFFNAMSTKKRAVLVWHRRAGKEKTCWNYLISQALQKVGIYYYFFPHFAQGRKILWDGIDKQGMRFLDHLPACLIDGKKNSTEMKIRLKNGSIIQVVGTNNIDSIVGTNPIGCVFSEYSLQDPTAWSLIRPILTENGGWAVFNFTPRGSNHAKELFDMAKQNPEWFCELLTVKDTNIIPESAIQSEREDGMSEDFIQQEFYCSFTLGIQGSYYSRYIQKMWDEGRITSVPYDEYAPVSTFWDIGVSDETVILFAQNVGQEVHIIDMYVNQGEGLAHYAKIIDQKAKDNAWIYDSHFAPHDIQVRELGSGAQTRLQIAKDLGVSFQITPNIPLMEGIELARGLFSRLWVDKDKCNYFIKAAENYQKRYNEKLNVYSELPLHNWASHTADAYRYLAINQSKIRKGHMSEEEAQLIEDKYSYRY